MSQPYIPRAKFLDPKSDIVFKKVFGQHPDLVKSFLNNILPLPDDALIESIEYLPPEQTPTIPVLKNTIVDVRCKDQKGRHFIVEMQLQWNSSFANRLLYGASKSYVQQLNKREDYAMLCPVYGLAIVNDTFDRNTQEWFHRYRLLNETTQDVIDKLELLFIELPKFKAETKLHRKMGIKWLRFLKEIDGQSNEIPDDLAGDPEIDKAIALVQESAYSLAELAAYDRYWDAISVEKTHIVDSLAAGEEKGLQKGIEKGLQQGKVEGLQEGIIKVAKAMKASGMSEEEIAKLTELSLETVRSLA